MKRLSIRMRVTLWFTAMMSLLAVLMLLFLYLAGQRTVRSLLRDRLTHVVQNSLDYIELDDGRLELDDDMDFFVNGVYRSIYDAEGRMLYGRIPEKYNGIQAFQDDTMQQFDDEEAGA